MFKALVKTRLLAMFSRMFRGSRLKKKRSKAMQIGIGALAVYVVGCFFMMFGMQFSLICVPFHQIGIDWLYFGMAGIVATALMFIGSIFTVQTQLYEAKDNELLLSMPIPPKFILASRLGMLLALNFIFEILIIIPAGVVYCMNVPISILGVICFVLAFLLLPLFSLALSCFIGWLVALISARVRNKSAITMALSLVFFGTYFYFYSRLNVYIQKLVSDGSAIATSIKGAALPVYWLGASIADANIMYLLLFALFCILPFVIVYAILSASFTKITTEKRGFAKIIYKEKSLKVNSAKTALLKKELKHFVSSPMYMLNGAMGVAFIVVGAVMFIAKQDLINTLTAGFPGIMTYIAPFAAASLCAITATNIISAPSISLEGKSLWIAQSLPVDGGDIIMAKAKMHMAVCLPSVIFAEVVFAFILKMSPLMTIILFVLPTLFTIFCALFGVIINLHFPKFDWISETVAVKQSMSTLIAMFGSFGVVLFSAALYFYVLKSVIDVEIYMLIVAIVLAIVCILMYRFLMTKGKEIFAKLG